MNKPKTEILRTLLSEDTELDDATQTEGWEKHETVSLSWEREYSSPDVPGSSSVRMYHGEDRCHWSTQLFSTGCVKAAQGDASTAAEARRRAQEARELLLKLTALEQGRR